MVSGIAAVSVPGTPGVSGQQPLQQGSLLCGAPAYDARQRFRRVCVPGKRHVKGKHQSVCGKARAGQLPSASGCRDELVRCKGGDRLLTGRGEPLFAADYTAKRRRDPGCGDRADRTSTASGAHNAHPPADRHGGSDDAALEHGRFRLRRVLPGDAPVLGEDDFDRGEGKGGSSGGGDDGICSR